MKREILLGPPGTGKTTALLRIVEEELSNGVNPAEIGYVSFTKKAAQEAVTRAIEKFGFDRRQYKYFRTLHSLCYEALQLKRGDVFEGKRIREFADWIGIEVSDFKTVEDGMMVGFKPGDRILFMEQLARLNRKTIYEQFQQDHDGLSWIEVDRVARGLQQWKEAKYLVDFTDMLQGFVDMDYSPQLEVLLVDEAQDLSHLQWRVVEKLARNTRRTIIAGDDDQAIYRWAGADVEHFINLDGDVRVLDQSWRVPPAVQEVGNAIIRGIRSRRPKEWSPADKEGSVERLQRLEQVDLSGDDILILARNAYILRQQVEPLLRGSGIIYSHRGDHSSVSEKTVQAILAWERLRAGGEITADQARTVYSFMRSGTKVARGYKQLPAFPSADEMVTLQQLREQGGLLTADIWHKAFDAMATDEKMYILRARQQGESLREKPRIHLSTIHSIKGGEADHVVLLTDMAFRTYTEYRQNPDDEARVWYVAVTRAQSKLTLIAPATRRSYAL